MTASIYEITKEGVLYSTDKSKLDVSFIHQFLTNAYWAKERTLEKVTKTIEHSLCYGAYIDDKQIGFARVVTDYTVAASLWDVFIDENHRGTGIAKIFMDIIFSSPITQEVDRWLLATLDAHGLYRKFGFTESPTLMRFLKNPNLLNTCTTTQT